MLLLQAAIPPAVVVTKSHSESGIAPCDVQRVMEVCDTTSHSMWHTMCPKQAYAKHEVLSVEVILLHWKEKYDVCPGGGAKIRNLQHTFTV